MTMWMVRSDGGKLISTFLEQNTVAIGWNALQLPASQFKNKTELKKAVAKCWPDWTAHHVSSAATQLHDFAHIFTIGDAVITYDPAIRQYYVGKITGDYLHKKGQPVDGISHFRSVKWDTNPVFRDDLSNPTKNSLGRQPTVFHIPDYVEQEIGVLLSGKPIARDIEISGHSQLPWRSA